MDIAAVVKNPWVWGFGLALGVVVIAIANSPKGEGDTAFNPNNVSSLDGMQTAQANAGASFAENMATIATSANINFEQQKTTRTLKVIDAIQNSLGVFSTVSEAASESADGVFNYMAQAQTALAVDRNLNNTRRDMIWVAGDVSKFTAQADGRVSVTNNLISSQAAKDKTSADAGAENTKNLLDFGKVLAGLVL